MPINFPDSPSANDTYTVNGRTYKWSGTKWRRHRVAIASSVPSLTTTNDFSAGDTLHVDSTNDSVGIGTATPNASDALTVGGDTTITGNMDVSGYITVPTQVSTTNDTKVATTEFVQTAISNLIGGAPAALDTLNELAAAINDDSSYAASITTSLAGKSDTSHTHSYADVSHTHSYAATSHTHSYLSTSGGTVSGDLSVTGRFQIGGHYIDDVAGSGNPYGSINVGGAMSWDGYAIDQRVVFMHDGGSNWGIYNDVSNEWMVYGQLDGGVELRYNNTKRLWTDNSGGRTDGRHYTTGDNYAYAYYGHSNVAGTGNAIYTPNGIYSTGTNWLYGKILTNGNDIGQSSQRIGQVWSNGWLRTVNATGWYNDTYAGGTYMTDANYVRIYNSKGLQSNKVCSRNYDTASIYINAPNDCALSFHPGGQAPQLRVGYNNNTVYFRNWPDTGWCTIEAAVINHSSRVDKQDITDFANRPSSLSSDGNSEYARSGTDIVRQLRPRHYRWDWDKNMRQLPLSQRRSEALSRLNAYREKQGLGEFLSDESWHVCGRDCDGTETDPCWWVKDWQNGYFGFVAEEVGEVAPEAGRLSPETGELSGLDPMAMSAIIVASLQEVLDRLDALEAK